MVGKDGEAQITIQVPPDVAQGEYRYRIVLLDRADAEGARTLNIPPINLDQWSEGFLLTREEMYDEWGR